jgi:hypothetical protein
VREEHSKGARARGHPRLLAPQSPCWSFGTGISLCHESEEECHGPGQDVRVDVRTFMEHLYRSKTSYHQPP